MDPINNITQIIRTIRKQADKTRASTTKSDSANTVKPPSTRRQKSIEELQTIITKKVKSVGNREKITDDLLIGAFVRAVLSWEFGEELMESPRFNSIVDAVKQELIKDKKIVKNIITLI